MATSKIPQQAPKQVCPTCGMNVAASLLKCPRCNTQFVTLAGCEGACFSCIMKSHCTVEK